MANFGGGFGGAATGAGLGSLFGPLGTAVGGGLGGLLGLFGGDSINGSQSEFKQQPRFSPQQQSFIEQLIQGLQGGESNIPGMEYLQGLFSNEPGAFQQYEAPALRQFNEQIIPGLAERFTGAGAGSRNSSAFNNATAMAGSRLSENLAAQRANLRGQGINQLQGFAGQAMQPQFENLYMQGQPGLMQGLAGGIGQGFGGLAGMNLFNKFQNQMGGMQSSGNQFPMTNQYENLFRMGAMQ